MSELTRLLARSNPSSLGVFGPPMDDLNGAAQDGRLEKERRWMEEINAELFAPADKDNLTARLSRPSLSYWEDAWIRLKKNKQAFVSLNIIVFLFLFTVGVPFGYRTDPSAQDLQRVSESPSQRRPARVLSELKPYEEVVRSDILESPEADPASLAGPANLELMDQPSTQSVRLKWDAVPGAAGYAVYRGDHEPADVTQLGIPIADIEGGNRLSLDDQFNLKPGTFYYSVVAKNQGTEAPTFSSIQVKIEPGISLAEAEKFAPGAKAGETVTLRAHPMGTDYLGRDVLARLMQGGKISLFIGLVAPLFATLFGIFIGGVSGYFGGKVDAWLMRITDFVMALPFLLFMILFKVVMGTQAGESGITAMLVAMVALSWTGPARLTRGQLLQLRESEFVQAARLLGAKPSYLILRHLLPNTLGVILVSLTFSIPTAIFTEAFLSFIGMGVVPPTPSWGSMCNEGIQTFLTHPHEFFFPAILISVAVLAFNLLGDGLRDALDPKLRAR